MRGLESFARRARELEQMDDLSIRDGRIERALRELRYVNRYLGGYRAMRKSLRPYLKSWEGGTLRFLDLGAGLGDYAVEFIRLGRRYDVPVHVTALDANPEAARCAQTYLDGHLRPDERARVRVIVGDALNAPGPAGSYHVVTASLFLHHFDDAAAVSLVRAMDLMASSGIVVNDLHRHVLAFAGIRALSAFFPVSPMFKHDGPLSVRRAFKPAELADIARRADLRDARIRRHWAFRLTLSTLPEPEGEGG